MLSRWEIRKFCHKRRVGHCARISLTLKMNYLIFLNFQRMRGWERERFLRILSLQISCRRYHLIRLIFHLRRHLLSFFSPSIITNGIFCSCSQEHAFHEHVPAGQPAIGTACLLAGGRRIVDQPCFKYGNSKDNQ